MNQKIIRGICLAVGSSFLAIGAIGVIIPVLPTTPFLLIASFFLARGSSRFHHWLMNTKLYKLHMHQFVTKKAMTLKTKWMILLPASTMMFIAIIICPVNYGRILIGLMIVFKYYYFFFRIATIPTLEGEL